MAILEQKYIIPPFSVFDTRQGYWQKRKKFWSEFGLYSDNGRCNVLGKAKMLLRVQKQALRLLQ